jgi:enamine deaminase RidA (YjgF/YER057c/UK114 family)
MWENVEALLKEAECSFDDVSQAIIYLRDSSDYTIVKELFDNKFPQLPRVIVHAPVCRPTWLVEMECIAVKSDENDEFKDF